MSGRISDRSQIRERVTAHPAFVYLAVERATRGRAAHSQFTRTTALRRHIGSGCRRWVGPVLADDHVSGLRVFRQLGWSSQLPSGA